jgi:DNA (cytosine-5)-methyltransferase 1
VRLLDLFCGAGGCSVGYHRAGFEVVGVDIEEHPDYPYLMQVTDAMRVVRTPGVLAAFDVVHASPPCQRYSTATAVEFRDRHPDFIAELRDALDDWGGVYVIENVPGSPLRDPVRVCGSSFDLGVRRHRLFESNIALRESLCDHAGREVWGVHGDHPDRPGGWLRPNGQSRGLKATSVEHAQEAMGIDWMTTWADLKEAVPPAYTEFIGRQLLESLTLSGKMNA